jgi:spermidine synthase
MRSSGPAQFAALCACFALSGFAALVYQTAWTREFAFVFGTSELAIAVVLAAYMAGLAVGSLVGGRLAPRVARPVLAYGLLELGIAVSALAIPAGLAAARAAMLAIFGGRAELPGAEEIWPSLFGLSASFLIMMIPTAFMGATLPLLATHAVQREAEIGSRVGALYALNTLGAVGGTLATAFLLLPALGLRATIWLAVAINACVFGFAAWIARAAGNREHSEVPQPTARPALAARWVLPLLAISGWVSFSYEVVWTRLLSHLLGGSIYSFAVMLASFLLGITAGAAAAARFVTDPRRAGFTVAGAQLGACALALASFQLLAWLPGWAAPRLAAGAGFGLHAAIALFALLPSAFCFGIAFPAGVRLLAQRPEDAGAASARAYSWNTAGAIAGALSCAYFTLPALAFGGTVQLLAATSAALAAFALLALRAGLRAAAVPLAAVVLISAIRPDEPWKLLLSSPLPIGSEADSAIRHYEVGRSATVLLADAGPARWRLRSNGLPESLIIGAPSLRRAGTSTRWLGALAPLLRPNTAHMASVGLGGGVHLEAIPGGISRIDVIEIEPAVVAANRAIGSQRIVDPLADPRVRVVANDARSALLLSGQRFDAIVAQASHPWTAGSSHLYTREFFELVDSRLADGGVFVQWMGAPFTNEELLKTLVATLLATWPHVQVYRPLGGDLLFAASHAPLSRDAEWIRTEVARDPAPMAALGIASPLDVDLALVLDEEGCRAFAKDAPLNTDDRNWLQMRSPDLLHSSRTLAQGGASPELDRLDAIAAPRPDADQLFLVRRLLELGNAPRAERAAQAVAGERARAEALALVASASQGMAPLAALLARNPDAAEARGQFYQLARPQVLASRRPVEGVPWTETPFERSVVAGWGSLGAADWNALRAGDGALAAIPLEHPLGPDARWLRAAWRAEIGDASEAREAGALLDGLIARGADRVEWYVTRARAHAREGAVTPALGALTEMVLVAGGRPIPGAWRRQAVDLLRSLEPEPQWEPWRENLLHALGR